MIAIIGCDGCDGLGLSVDRAGQRGRIVDSLIYRFRKMK
jgi:hypothetical protein